MFIVKSTPAFLIGHGRSGTSMIVKHLAKSRQVKLFNEDHPQAFENWHLRDLSVIDKLVRNSRSKITLFKPVKDTYLLPVLLARFPNAKVLFAFRNYNDVINSHRKKFYDANGRVINPKNIDQPDRRPSVVKWLDSDFAEFSACPPPEQLKQFIRSRWKPALNLESIIALDWIFYNRLFLDTDFTNDSRVMTIQYENLVSNTEEEFKQVCQFLGIGYHKGMIAGIHSTSIRRDPPPELDPVIGSDCEELWERLKSLRNESLQKPV